MSSSWKIVVIAGLAILLSGVGYWLYLHYRSFKGPRADALEAIHPGVVFLAQSDDIRAALYKLTAETDFWPGLLADTLLHRFQDRFLYLDSLIASYGWLNELVEMQKFTVSLNRDPEGRYDFIFLLELPPGDYDPSFEGFIKSVNGPQSIVLQKTFDRAAVRTINLSGPEALFYYSIYKGLLIGSFNELLVEASILQLGSKNSLLRKEDFRRIHSTAGKNVEANLYIHIPNFIAWAGLQLSEEYRPVLQGLKEFGSWTEIDVLVRNDNLLFNGYTISNNAQSTFPERFQQAPQSVKATEVLPYDLAWMMHWGVDSYRDFLNASKDATTIDSLYLFYEKEFGIDLETEFIALIGHELVLSALPDPTGHSHPLVTIHSGDVVKAALALGEMEAKVNRKNRTGPFLFTHKDYNIRRLGLNRLFSDLFGEPFPEMDACYYVTLKDYILFSDKSQHLVKVIDDFYSRKTLAETPDYQAFSDNISDRSNIYLYANLKKPDPFFDGLFAGWAGSERVRNLYHFEGLALQFSFINGMFYTNMFLRYNPEYKEVTATNWKTALKAGVVAKPFPVKNHRNGTTNLVVFDAGNTMYLLDHLGRIQWQLQLEEAPVGEVQMVDYYGNLKFQYLFNTPNYIYLVDLNGNKVADYPHKLEALSTGPLAVYDYDTDGSYRILIPLSDNKVHNFNLQFSAIAGWEKVQASGRVNQAVQYLRHGGKDYLFVADDHGFVMITDRRGVDRIKPAAKINKAKHSGFYINRTNGKGLFLTTDTVGQVVYVDEKGGVSRTVFGAFNPGHYFFYDDFNGDDHLDFLFIDQNRMVVFDRFKNVITEQQFPEVITLTPVLFSWAGRKYVGVVLDAAGEIQIFDHQGRCFRDLFLEGTLPFATGTFDPVKLNLITAKGSKVLNYQLN